MRTIEQFKRDTYFLNLIKEASVFTMMAFGFFNEPMMSNFGPMFAIMAVTFMFIPRVIINDFLDGDNEGAQQTNSIPSWKRSLNVALNYIKFVCLVILTLYIFLNKGMMEFGGTLLLWFVSFFMVIPRKLINIIAQDAHN